MKCPIVQHYNAPIDYKKVYKDNTFFAKTTQIALFFIKKTTLPTAGLRTYYKKPYKKL